MADEIVFAVEAGHIMLFARACGDENPIYHDADYARSTEVGGIIAPPTFERVWAQWDPDYPLRPRQDEPWFGSAKEPSGGVHKETGETEGTGLHAEQHYVYHRPIRAGETLTARKRPGRRWEKEGRRAGLMRFSEEIVDLIDANGDVVVSATEVNVITAKPVDQ